MNRVFGCCILSCLIFLLLACSPVFAESVKDVTIIGLGTVSIPANVEVSEVTFNKDKATGFLVNDGDVWRSCLFICGNVPKVSVDDIEKVPSFIQGCFESIVADGSGKLLKAVPARSLTIGGVKAVAASAKVVMSGLAFDMEVYFLPQSQGVTMVMCMSSDGDSQYWQPFYLKMLGTLKRENEEAATL